MSGLLVENAGALDPRHANSGGRIALNRLSRHGSDAFGGGSSMTNVYVEARSKGWPEGSRIEDYLSKIMPTMCSVSSKRSERLIFFVIVLRSAASTHHDAFPSRSPRRPRDLFEIGVDMPIKLVIRKPLRGRRRRLVSICCRSPFRDCAAQLRIGQDEIDGLVLCAKGRRAIL